MGVLNAAVRFRNAARETELYTKHPKRIREVFNIRDVNEDGIFTIQQNKGSAIYDRCYVFTDTNFVNKDPDQQNAFLENMMIWLNTMTVHFKITMANEYRDVHAYIRDLTRDRHREEHAVIGEGVDAWIEEKLANGEVQDLNRVMYLTITKEAAKRETAKNFFLKMDAQLERLFKTMGSEIRPLNGKERLETLRFLFHPDETECPVSYDFRNKLKDPMNTVLPAALEQEKNWMQLGDRYACVLFAREYASSVKAEEVLHAFSTLPYISMLTLDYAPIDRRLLKDMLEAAYMNNEKAIAQETDARRSRGQYALGISFAKEARREELEEYMLQVENNNESSFHLCLLFVVTADSEKELASVIEEVRTTGKEKGIYMETCNHTQLKSLNTALPNGCRNICYPRNFLTSSVVAYQPFYAQELQEQGGIFYGLNRTTRHLVFGNRKLLASPHGVIIGYTGSGKSFFIKETEVAQTLLATDDDLITLDPQNEMQGICREFGGQFIDLTPKAQIYINPLEVPEDILKTNSAVRSEFVAEQSGWIRSFCQAAMRNIILTEEHIAVLSRAVREIYEELFEKGKVKEQPTLKDVREKIRVYMENASAHEDKSIARRLYNSLEEYTEGAFDLFAHPSNIDINKRFVVFGLANVPHDLWEPVMITIMHFLSNRMDYNKKLGRPTRLIIDEAQEVCRNESSAGMLLRAIRTYRKFGGMVTMALQNLTGALENDKLRDMFSNCGYKYFLNQSGIDAEQLRSIQDLSMTEYESLSEDRPGYGLLVWGNKVIKLDSVMSRDNPLYEMFSTNFHEKAKKGMFYQLPEEAGVPEPGPDREWTVSELDAAVLKLTDVVPVSMEELVSALGIDRKAVTDAVKRLLDAGELSAVTDTEGVRFMRMEKAG